MKKLNRIVILMSWLALLLTSLSSYTAMAQTAKTYTQHLSYDTKDRETSFTYANGQVETYHYNNLDYRIGVQSSGFTRQHHDIDLQGRYWRTTTAANSTPGFAVPAGETRYLYDVYGRTRDHVMTVNGNQEYAAHGMDYNAQGMLTEYELQGGGYDGTVSYSYGSQFELTQFAIGSQSVDYTYDSRGNMVAHNAAFDMQPFQSSFNAGNPYHNDAWTYDAAGRVTDDGNYTYHYNKAGRLALIRDSKTRKVVASYLYDAGGQRVRTLNHKDLETHTVRNMSDAVVSEVLVDRSGDAIETKNYIRFSGALAATYTYDANNTLSEIEHAATDRFSSPVLRWTPREIKRQEYSPYGQQMGDDAYRVGPHGFTGEHSDDETGLTYMNARYFDPVATSFLRPDPIFDFDPTVPMSYNLYRYTYNNPINNVDPTGRGSLAIGGSGRIEFGNLGQDIINRSLNFANINYQVHLGYAVNLRMEANYTTGDFAIILQGSEVDSGWSTGWVSAGVTFETTNATSIDQRLGPSRTTSLSANVAPMIEIPSLQVIDGQGYEGFGIEFGPGFGPIPAKKDGIWLPQLGASFTESQDHTLQYIKWKGPGQQLGLEIYDLLGDDKSQQVMYYTTEFPQEHAKKVDQAAIELGSDIQWKMKIADKVFSKAKIRMKTWFESFSVKEDTTQTNVQ